MILSVSPGVLRGGVRAPCSKSHAQRLLIASALCEGETRVSLGGTSDDIDACARCLRALGARVDWSGDICIVRGISRASAGGVIELDVGESGVCLRFMLALTCALNARARLTLSGRLPERPIEPLARELISHGARIDGVGTRCVSVCGALTGGDYTLPGDVSSQFVSALLMALPLLSADSVIHIPENIESGGYIELTLDVMRAFGVRAMRVPGGVSVPGGQKYVSPGRITAEGDWSGAAMLLCCASACGGDVRVTGLSDTSAQCDRAILRILRDFGARAEFTSGAARVGGGALTGREVDVSYTPDLAPALALLGAAARGVTVLRRAGRLRLKESDRLARIVDVLTRLGARAWARGDDIFIEGGSALVGGEADAAGDHRICMMAACLSVLCARPVRVSGFETVNKSYPGFARDMASLGLEITEERLI